MKKLVALALAMLMALSLVSVSALAEGEEPDLLFLNQAAWKDIMTPILEQYYVETGVRIAQENYSFNDLIDTIEVKIGTGSADYDMMLADVPLVASYASRGMIQPIDAYFTDEEKALLVPAAVQAGSFGGEFYAPAICNSSQLLWYNTKLLEEAGFDMTEFDAYNTSNRITYERVAEIAREAIAKIDPDHAKGIIGFDFQQVDRVYQMNGLANSMGGAQIDATGFSADGVLNTEPWEKALTWYQNMVKEGICSRGITASEMPNMFYSDKVIFLIGTTDMVANCARNNMPHYGYMPAPAFKGYEDKVGTPTGSWHIALPKTSPNAEKAAAFIKWYTIGHGAELFYEALTMLPTYVPLLNQLTEDEATPSWMKIAIYESMNTAVPRALTPGYNQYATVMNALWSDVRNGEDVKETVDWAVEEIDAVMKPYVK